MSQREQGTGLVTPGSLTPVAHLRLLERVFPEIAPSLREMREHWIQQFELHTAAELLLLDQALLGYAYLLKMGQPPAAAGERRECQGDPARPGDDPTEAAPAAGEGGKKMERRLRLLVRLNKMFVRSLNAMKRWKTQDVGTAVFESVMKNLRR